MFKTQIDSLAYQCQKQFQCLRREVVYSLIHYYQRGRKGHWQPQLHSLEKRTQLYIAFSEDRYFSFGLVRIDTSVLG